MKKFNLTIFILLMVLGSAMAQKTEKQKTFYQKVDVEIPPAVLEAVKKSNPDFQIRKDKDLMLSKKKNTFKKRGIKSDKKRNYTFYTTIKYKEGKVSRKKEIYNESGILLSSSEFIKNGKLPVTALRTMGREYNKWALVGTRTFIEEKRSMRMVIYDITLKNGKEKKHVLLNEQGQIEKDKSISTLLANRQD